MSPTDDTEAPPSIRTTMERLAPGTELREGIERIMGSHRGALLVIGDTEEIAQMCTGGFEINSPLTAPRLGELAKMDGAIVIDAKATRLVRANVHLVPSGKVQTEETGTRHRTAERVARQTGQPVIAVSESMRMVTIYAGDEKRTLEEVTTLLFKANQALSTLERYRSRLDEVAGTLSAREVEDTVLLRDVALMMQRLEMVRRIAGEVGQFAAELGHEGRLIRLQLDELVSDIEVQRQLLVSDYIADRRRKNSRSLRALDALEGDEVIDLEALVATLGYEGEDLLDRPVTSRGHRLLARIPRLPSQIAARVAGHFPALPKILDADIDELLQVEGVGEMRARALVDGLRRVAESSLMDRLV